MCRLKMSATCKQAKSISSKLRPTDRAFAFQEANWFPRRHHGKPTTLPIAINILIGIKHFIFFCPELTCLSLAMQETCTLKATFNVWLTGKKKKEYWFDAMAAGENSDNNLSMFPLHFSPSLSLLLHFISFLSRSFCHHFRRHWMEKTVPAK